MTPDERAFGFVMGTLPSDESRKAEEDLAKVGLFREKVAFWRGKLAPLEPRPLRMVTNPVSFDRVAHATFEDDD